MQEAAEEKLVSIQRLSWNLIRSKLPYFAWLETNEAAAAEEEETRHAFASHSDETLKLEKTWARAQTQRQDLILGSQ